MAACSCLRINGVGVCVFVIVCVIVRLHGPSTSLSFFLSLSLSLLLLPQQRLVRLLLSRIDRFRNDAVSGCQTTRATARNRFLFRTQNCWWFFLFLFRNFRFGFGDSTNKKTCLNLDLFRKERACCLSLSLSLSLSLVEKSEKRRRPCVGDAARRDSKKEASKGVLAKFSFFSFVVFDGVCRAVMQRSMEMTKTKKSNTRLRLFCLDGSTTQCCC